MKHFILLILWSLLAPALLFAQAITTPAPVLDHTHADQKTHFEICVTTQLLDSEEGRQAMRAFQLWDTQGRPRDQLLDSYDLGDQRTFKVLNFETNNVQDRSFTLRAVGEFAFLWVEDEEYSEDKITSEHVQEMLNKLEEQTPINSVDPDRGILDINQHYFGNPPDADGSGKLHLLIVNIRDGWDPDTGGGFVGGFFFPADLNPNDSRGNGGMDIIYINSYPTIYSDEREADIGRALNLIAHEYQHLIHANYGNLNIFQNEGQSEWAELLNGFSGRNVSYLFKPDEVNRYLYDWRSGDFTLVLNDYQRASLFHSYIAERYGPELTGSITRTSLSGNGAYQAVFDSDNSSVSEILTDFHIANFLNDTSLDPAYGYNDPRRVNIGNPAVALTYQPGTTSADAQRSLRYGGAEYIEFFGVEDFTINGTADTGVQQFLYTLTIDGNSDFFAFNGSATITGQFEKIVLLSAFTQTSGSVGVHLNVGYTYTADWNSLPLIQEQLSYFGEIQFFTNLPGDPNDNRFAGRKKFAYRFSPGIDGRLQQVKFTINPRESGIVGNTDLMIMFAEAVPASFGFEPATPSDTLFVPFSSLGLGDNNITAPDGWNISEGEEYFVLFETADPNAGMLELLLDGGSMDETNTNYFPPRTLIYITPPTVDEAGWYFFGGDQERHNNLAVSIQTSGLYTGELEVPTITVAQDSLIIAEGSTLEITAQVTGKPSPSIQWYRNGQPISNARSATLKIENVQKNHSGTYRVEAINFAGKAESETFEVLVEPAALALRQNYPNPFNPSTTIPYTVPGTERQPVRITIYSLDGKLVKILVNQFQNPGSHTAVFDASGLASGLYIYQLRVKDEYLSNKMMLVR